MGLDKFLFTFVLESYPLNSSKTDSLLLSFLRMQESHTTDSLYEIPVVQPRWLPASTKQVNSPLQGDGGKEFLREKISFRRGLMCMENNYSIS